MSDVVLFELLKCSNGKHIGIATLNSEKSLNALSHNMVKSLYPKLKSWQQDDNIVAVVLQGTGSKAFCAGGDVVHLYHNLPNQQGDSAPDVEAFFTDEYKLDFLIHTFEKPFIVWGHGIVMGGGLGLMVGGSHRIVTENTKIAMPEISIGLYPDVGATYFLNKMPDNCGLFLGLTGATMNAADAIYTNLADNFITNDKKSEFIMKLIMINWCESLALNHQRVSHLLHDLEEKCMVHIPGSNVKKHQTLISELTSADTLGEIVEAIKSKEIDDQWFNKAQKSLSHGSPVSAQLTYRQLQEGKDMTLADCFRLELGISTKCSEFGEFKEGVRALLIEKDNKPSWKYPSVEAVAEQDIEWFFSPQWADVEHPLATLGK
ncbi:enoyl-CoA hydratase/isomerase family protein [Thalassotalea aquiviva]|uniref:enoyl-CoA hydratase/isomerase family protein n=1 Tax=Thalassotalea aquiviva TaxID=3242415 RepID=UPI00352A07ED